MAALIERAQEVVSMAVVISPRLGDFNEDLRLLGVDPLRAASRVQIAAQDVARFMELAAWPERDERRSPASSPRGRRSCFPSASERTTPTAF